MPSPGSVSKLLQQTHHDGIGRKRESVDPGSSRLTMNHQSDLLEYFWLLCGCPSWIEGRRCKVGQRGWRGCEKLEVFSDTGDGRVQG
jgi:hypothetical protein